MKRMLFVVLFLFLSVGLFAAEGIAIRENSFQTDKPLLRAERPFQLLAEIENESKAPFQCRLTLPDGLKPIGENVETDANEFATKYTWDIVLPQPGQTSFTLDLLVDGKVVQTSTISQAVLEPLPIRKLDYIPAPQPVKTKMLVGVHNCPLWETDRAQLWNQVVRKHQERTPALGIYSQDNPEIADWETKWALEHGISFFIYCWYRTSQGGEITTQFEKSIFDDALFKSKFGDQMQFTIMWENQSRGKAGIDDEKDLFENLLPYWMEKFFKRKNYLKIDNKPVLFVYQPIDVSKDLGGDDKAKAAFEMMREAAKKEGFDGLWILGEYRGANADQLRRYQAMGLDYVFEYCWYVHDSPPPEVVIEKQMEQIQAMQDKRGIIPQIVTLSQAWSGWQDEGSIWKLPPNDFEKLLRLGKEFVEKNIPENELGSKMIILDNWNEWSEGHYIAPYREYGFGYLDAVRRVFSDAPEKHLDLIPEDIGLGPYDMPRSLFENRTAWDFAAGDPCWQTMMNLKDLRLESGAMRFETTTGDPAIRVVQDKTTAGRFSKLAVRMKTSLQQSDMMQLYWLTETEKGFSEKNTVRAAVKPGGFHDYVLTLSPGVGWKGRITELRFDPCCKPGIDVEVESIRLE